MGNKVINRIPTGGESTEVANDRIRTTGTENTVMDDTNNSNKNNSSFTGAHFVDYEEGPSEEADMGDEG